MNVRWMTRSACGLAVAALSACGGSGMNTSGSMPTSNPQMGTVAMMVSDAPSDDWAIVGVRILSIALVPQGGGSPVTVYTAPSPAPMINLVELDQLAELLGNASVPAGTYTGAILTVSGNSGDVQLMVSMDPEAGFAAAAGSTIASNQIEVQNTQGSAGSVTVPVKVSFDSPLIVTANSSNALDLEIELNHPAFIVGHQPPGAGMTLWAVNFRGPVRRHPIPFLTHLVLRHVYGNVTAVSSDNTSITFMRDFPTRPLVNPETATASGQSLTVLADAANGTIFYDLDARTRTIVKDFSAQAATLAGKYVRIAARYQDNGTLVGVRIWASSDFNNVWASPEGHVLHVDATNDVITVINESGAPVKLTVDANTQFFFRTPQNAQADATPIGTGPSFLANNNMVRGFKVHASVDDVLATPLVAQSIDIETAAYSGRISAASTSGFTYAHDYPRIIDDYSLALGYIADGTANGTDGSGNAVSGYKYWDFAYPTLVTTGANAIPNFVSAVGGSSTTGVSFAGTMIFAWGISGAVWGDTANPTGWSLPWTVLMPTPLPLGLVASGLSNNQFTMNVLGGTTPGTVSVSTTSGSATLVYQIDRQNGVLTVSPIDITTSDGLAAFTTGLAVGAPVKVYGVPESDGTLKAYALTYFTGNLMPED